MGSPKVRAAPLGGVRRAAARRMFGKIPVQVGLPCPAVVRRNARAAQIGPSWRRRWRAPPARAPHLTTRRDWRARPQQEWRHAGGGQEAHSDMLDRRSCAQASHCTRCVLAAQVPPCFAIFLHMLLIVVLRRGRYRVGSFLFPCGELEKGKLADFLLEFQGQKGRVCTNQKLSLMF